MLDIVGAATNWAVFYMRPDFDQLELAFRCNFSGNDACPTNRFQTAAIRLVELGRLNAIERVDLTSSERYVPMDRSSFRLTKD